MDDMLLKMLSATNAASLNTVDKARQSANQANITTDDGFGFGSIMKENARLHDQTMRQPRHDDAPKKKVDHASEKTEHEPVQSERKEEPRDVQKTDEPKQAEKDEAKETAPAKGEKQSDDAPIKEQAPDEAAADASKTTDITKTATAKVKLAVAVVDEAIAADKATTSKPVIQSDAVATEQPAPPAVDVVADVVTTNAPKLHIETNSPKPDTPQEAATKATVKTAKVKVPQATNTKPAMEAKVETGNKVPEAKVTVNNPDTDKTVPKETTKAEKVNVQHMKTLPDETVAKVKTEAPKAKTAETQPVIEQRPSDSPPIATMQEETSAKAAPVKATTEAQRIEKKVADDVRKEKPAAELLIPKTVVRKSVHNRVSQAAHQTFDKAITSADTVHTAALTNVAALDRTSARSNVVRATPTQPAQSFDQNHFLDSVMRQARMIQRPDGSSEINMNLRPQELGAVVVKLTMHNDHLTAHFQVDSTVVRDMVQDLMQRVRESLADEGIDLDSCNIDLRQEADPEMHKDPDADSEEDASMNFHTQQGATKAQSHRLSNGSSLSSASSQMNFVA